MAAFLRMMKYSREESRPTGGVVIVRIAQLPELAAELERHVRAAGFAPEVIIYLETGARLIAHELGTRFGLPLFGIAVRRGGYGLKRKLAPVAARLPVWLRDCARRIEQFSGIHRYTSRTTSVPPGLMIAGRRVLLVDDAADTGRTLETARKILMSAGVSYDDLRTAVLAATTPRGRAVSDFYLFDCVCRMPWSSDSEERGEAEAIEKKLFSNAPRPF